MADYGLIIRDPSTGNVLLSLTNRITRMVGIQSTGAGAGSIQVPSSISGDVWYAPFVFPPIAIFQTQTPKITLSGRTISWTANSNAIFAYGVY